MAHRLESLLDLSWDEDGYLLTKLTRLVKVVKSKNYAVDCASLLGDLLYWNGEKQTVQLKWARALYMKPEEKTSEEGA
jgi:CRISPR type I-E-associated protein CasB/Cse2